MNWDWDKLQEKRNHQPGGFDGKGKKTQDNKNSRNHDNKPSEDNEKDERPFGFGGGGNNNNKRPHPFGAGKDPREMINNLNVPAAKWIIIAVALLWLASGIFIVRPDESGVVLRFGAYNRTLDAGMHYHLPFPIESVALPKVTQVRQIVVGQESQNTNSSFNRGANIVNDEASMLTGDENIVNIQFIIQYYIKPDGVVDYLYKVAQPDNVVKKAAEAAMREVIGKTMLDNALTVGRNQIQANVEDLLQNILDHYEVGIQVVAVQMQDVQPPVPVRDAFKDVASAREDRERLTNEAEAYRSDILPKAQGSAAEKINQAEAYKQTRIRNAEGETSRFLAVLTEYNKAKDVTKKRLLLETMEQLLDNPNIDKVVLPAGMSQQVLPFLPLGPTSSINQTTRSTEQQATNTAPTADTSMTANNIQSRSTARGGR